MIPIFITPLCRQAVGSASTTQPPPFAAAVRPLVYTRWRFGGGSGVGRNAAEMAIEGRVRTVAA
jgi:hypothetical protein